MFTPHEIVFIVEKGGDDNYFLCSWWDVYKDWGWRMTVEETDSVFYDDTPLTVTNDDGEIFTIWKWTTVREYDLSKRKTHKESKMPHQPMFDNTDSDRAAMHAMVEHFHGPNAHNPLLKESNMSRSFNFVRFLTILAVGFCVLVGLGVIKGVLHATGVLPPVQGIILLPEENGESVLLCFEECGEPGDVIDLGKDVGTGYCTDHGWIVENVGHKANFDAYKRAAHDLCGFKANERPWHQRMIGMAGHNHFVHKGETVVYAVQDSAYMDAHPGGMTTSPEQVGRHLEQCDTDFNLIWTK